jgi:hypothetical protein
MSCTAEVGKTTGGEVPGQHQGWKTSLTTPNGLCSRRWDRARVGEEAVRGGVGARPGANDSVLLACAVHRLAGF